MKIYVIFAHIKKKCQVRRIISIPFILISVVLLLIFAVVPHHHHGGMPCLTMEVCEGAKACCEGHHDHGHDGCTGHEDGSCIIEDALFVAHLDNELLYKALQSVDCGHDLISHYPLSFIVADLLNFDDSSPLPSRHPDDRQGDYISADVDAPQGLRAPPFGLV